MITNMSKVLSNLALAFANKEITLTPTNEESISKEIKGVITGVWCNPNKTSVHLAFVEDGTSWCKDICIPVTINDAKPYCFLPYSFGNSLGDAIELPKVEGIDCFLETFRSCLN